MNVFRWKNCYADVAASKHGISVQSFFDDVVVPAIQTLEGKIFALGRSDDPGDVFAQSDAEDVLHATKMAFALSIQSIWERQLRGYLSGCAKELRPNDNVANKAERGDWNKLCELFLELRGIGLETFPSFAELDTLHLLGNACRHGDGPSAIELTKRCPDLWRNYSPVPFDDVSHKVARSPIALMEVSMDRLQVFVVAIVSFWNDAEYIYNESIERKHPSLQARLARERAERSWRPQTADGCA
ncbi:hypothetical protein ACVBE8_001463 [Klebsiella pneumoniae]|uniref:hypothetical protein n=1 Tax=Burkholderia anthina TaxID=179879 RepID=UPI0015896B8C|nr:hypothetical protein [Klebsiella oxytoca]